MSFLSRWRQAKEEQERRERELLAHPCLKDSNGIASPIYCYCPDDFTVCLSVQDMEFEIEPNDVDEPYEIFDAIGKVMRAKLDSKGYVKIILDEQKPANPGRLEEIIRGVARSWKNQELPEPLSLEDLNYYILVNKIGR
jgi:hypothetical protein